MTDTLEQDIARPAPETAETPLGAAIATASTRIAPVWPLRNFVAVNPFLGFSGQSFHATCASLYRVCRLRALMPRAFYREALRTQHILDLDLAEALAEAPLGWHVPRTVPDLRAAALRDPARPKKHPAVVATVAEILNDLAGGDRYHAGTAFMTDEISRFCAAYFDEGQSVWRLPSRALKLYPAWRALMRHDLNAEMMGIAGFRALIAAMPDDPAAAIGQVIERQGIPPRAIEDYLHQALRDIGGWAAYASYLAWNAALDGTTDDTLLHLLAIRVVWGYTLFVQRTDEAFRTAWRDAMAHAAQPPADENLGDDPDLAIDMVLQEAFEAGIRRRLLARLAAPRPPVAPTRPKFQAAFCIDVRSEIYRRAIEAVLPDAETIGFAGFFGFPIEFLPIGLSRGRAHCPVLLKPAYTVRETVIGASEAENQRILSLRQLRRRVRKAWKAFKLSAVSSFLYVETAGLLFAGKILGDTLSLTRPVHDPETDGFDEAVIGRLGPDITPREVAGRHTGFTLEERIGQAEAVLRAMSLFGPFARLVLLAGHGSTTVNNPHASGLDCGACGGHTGEANARVAAAILNDPEVRQGLSARGIAIPADTWFIGTLHDTTTDDIRLFDTASLPASHEPDLAAVRQSLLRATTLARLERAGKLGIPHGPRAEQLLLRRARDWAEVRPEWGLAGNHGFIAAPRARTRRIDLEGRVFLHDYTWQRDENFATLELIMTAPMIVATWINLQYYGSVVNNEAFGCGNKVLHNVTGTIGVLEGNAGDLRPGLPLQSLHDGQHFVHEPVRLTVVIEAPLHAIDAVIAKHRMVRDLIDNRWLHLYAINEAGCVSHRYRGQTVWEPLA